MAMKWNWKKLCFGSATLVAAVSTAVAYSPSVGEKDQKDSVATNRNSNWTLAYMKAGVVAQAASKDKEQMLQEAIQKSRKLCKRLKNEQGLPGLAIAVSVNGKTVWQEGFGFANLENEIRMKPENIMRIASISKSMTMAMMAKLMEEGKIDIDKPIQTYLPTYPEKCVDGDKVTITTRHLLSHLSGIRHYTKKEDEKQNKNDASKDKTGEKDGSKTNDKKKKKQKDSRDKEMELAEYFLKDKFASVEESLKLFKDDELFHKPGTKFLYTSHGWTVVAAIIEKLTNTEFPKHCKRMFDFWGLKNTTLDIHEPIIYNRASYYTRLEDGQIINSPYVDSSYKWAGGGFLSNVLDLTQFAHILLYSMQTPEDSSQVWEKGLPKIPFLKRSTIKTVWTGNPLSERQTRPDLFYGLGFEVGEPLRKCVFCKERDLMTVSHSGAAIGASSLLLLTFPVTIKTCDTHLLNTACNCNSRKEASDVNGVVVAMITNLTSVSLYKTAYDITDHFKGLI